MTTLAETGARLLGGVLHRADPLGGGDLSQILRLDLADGRTLKGGGSPPTEASMLKAIAEAGAPAPKLGRLWSSTMHAARHPARPFRLNQQRGLHWVNFAIIDGGSSAGPIGPLLKA